MDQHREIFRRSLDRYVITLDHRPQTASFEISQDASGRYVYTLKASNGSMVFSQRKMLWRQENPGGQKVNSQSEDSGDAP